MHGSPRQKSAFLLSYCTIIPFCLPILSILSINVYFCSTSGSLGNCMLIAIAMVMLFYNSCYHFSYTSHLLSYNVARNPCSIMCASSTSCLLLIQQCTILFVDCLIVPNAWLTFRRWLSHYRCRQHVAKIYENDCHVVYPAWSTCMNRQACKAVALSTLL